jgi:3-deoxy-7-phosphoheptulonate synthase
MNSSVSALPLSTLSPANEALTLRLPSSLQLKQQLPLTNALNQQVAAHRQAVRAILNGEDSRLLVIVGPCSIHDPKSALEYAGNLAQLAAEVSDEMLWSCAPTSKNLAPPSAGKAWPMIRTWTAATTWQAA